MTENSFLNEVRDAMHSGDRATAKMILMKLIRGDQKNPLYWLYLSAVMETKDEKISCLQKVLKLDSEHEAAKMGMRLLGEVSETDAIAQIEWSLPSLEREFPIVFYGNDDSSKERGKKRKKRQKTEKELAKQKRNQIVFASVGAAAVLFLLIFRPFAPTVYVYPTATEGEAFSLVDDTSTPSPYALTETTQATSIFTVTPAADYTSTPIYVRTPHADEYYRLALKAIDDEEWEEALFYLDVLIKTDPYSADIYYHTGQVYQHMGEFQKAYRQYGLAAKQDTEFGAAYLSLAEMEMELYPVSTAKNNLDLALEFAPDYINVYLIRVKYFLEMGDFEQALIELLAAEAIDSDLGVIYLLRAEIYYAQGEFDKALDEAKIAHGYLYRMDETSPLLGLIYLSLGEGDKAFDLLEIYQAENPDDLEAQFDLGLAYLTIGEYNNAIELFDALTDVKDLRNSAYTYLGRAYLESGELEKARDALKYGAGLNPYWFEPHFYLAKTYQKMGESTNAFQSFVNALKQDMTVVEEIEVVYNFALFCEEYNLEDEAEKYWAQLSEFSTEKMSKEIFDELVKRFPQYMPTKTSHPTMTPWTTRTPIS